MPNKLDIVIYGASGFTGKHTIPQVHKFAKVKNLSWGVAGRSLQKIKNVLSKTAEKIGEDYLNFIPIIIAHSNDEESVKTMTARAKVIVNCCGPYDLYGEVVVKSCIKTETHYVDISVETQFIEEVELKYHKAAEEKGVYIVSGCGFGSIPPDLGLAFLEENFEGTLNSVETYLEVYEEGGFSGPATHSGTWESLINFLKNTRNVIGLIKRYTNPSPTLQPKLLLRFPYRKESNKWVLPYPVFNKDVMVRSQQYFHEQEGKRPVQVYCYALLNSFKAFMHVVFIFFVVAMFSLCEFGRKLLIKHLQLFSGGLASHELSEEVLDRQKFSYTLEGIGWSEKLAEGEDEYKTKPNKAIIGRVSGTNPGYGFTCGALALCAVLILTERKMLPVKGGVYTTAAAFSKTSIIEQLQENGAVFEILSIKDL